MVKKISENDSVLLVDEKGKKFLFTVEDRIQRIKGLGVYNPGDLIGKKLYENIVIGNRTFSVIEPSISDKIKAIERKAQIILPKDGMFIIYHCDIKSGDRVLEAGAGSGALSILLANFIRPKGKVISYENRNEHLKVAKRNLLKAGLLDHVDINKGDVTENIKEKNLDAVVLDIPNPWDAVENGYSALRPGGHLAVYTPSVNQFEKTHTKMREFGFGEITTLETLQREMMVRDRGVRPSFDMLGHTGYITFTRRLI
jgi:tRNA (adenine57-N1/adenine58-N1)-methyltransferase